MLVSYMFLLALCSAACCAVVGEQRWHPKSSDIPLPPSRHSRSCWGGETCPLLLQSPESSSSASPPWACRDVFHGLHMCLCPRSPRDSGDVTPRKGRSPPPSSPGCMQAQAGSVASLQHRSESSWSSWLHFPVPPSKQHVVLIHPTAPCHSVSVWMKSCPVRQKEEAVV